MLDEYKELEENEVMKLSNELMYQRYLMNRGQSRDFNRKVSTQEYIALHNIVLNNTSDIYSGRTYLKDLSAKLQRTSRQTSGLVRN